MKILVLLAVVFPLVTFAGESLPSRARRVKALEDSGLTLFVQGMDELDQDLLYMRARTKGADQLKAFYPKLPVSNLQLFVKEAQ